MSIYTLFLDVRDERSTWGWDSGMDCFYAQLYRNGSAGDRPDIWLTPPDVHPSWLTSAGALLVLQPDFVIR